MQLLYCALFQHLKKLIMSFPIQKIDRSETIEITILNKESRQYKFGDVDTTLNKVVLHGIALHSDALIKSFTGKTVLPTASMKKGFLTLANAQNEQPVKRLPLEMLLNNETAVTWFEPKLIEIGKCFVDLPDSSALVLPGDNLGFAIPFTLMYTVYDPAVHSNLK